MNIKKLIKISIFSILLITTLSQPVLAKANKVMALSDFDTDNPPQSFQFEIVESGDIDNNNTIIPNRYILDSTVIKINPNKRLKRNASFVLKIDKITSPNGEIYTPKYLYAKYTTNLDKCNAAKNVALSVGDHFVKGISIGFKTIEGAVENEKGNVIKSAGSAFYNATPISYINEGEEIVLKKGDTFLLKFSVITDDIGSWLDKKQYSYDDEN